MVSLLVPILTKETCMAQRNRKTGRTSRDKRIRECWKVQEIQPDESGCPFPLNHLPDVEACFDN